MNKNNLIHRTLLIALLALMAGGCASMSHHSAGNTPSPDQAGVGPRSTFMNTALNGPGNQDPLFSVPDPDHPTNGDDDTPPPYNGRLFPLGTDGTTTDHSQTLQSILANYTPPDGLDDGTASAAGDDAGTDTAATDDLNGAPNLWDRIRVGMTMDEYSNRRIDMEVQWFVDHQAYLDRTAERAKYYLHYIVDAVQKRQLPTEITLLPIVESAYQPFAYSHGRAAGIWQFIPSTAKLYGLKRNWWYDGRRDVIASTNAALDYLQQLRDRFDGDWLLALAAYNSGEGTVENAVRWNRRHGRPTDFWSLRLPAETRGYVPRLLAIAKIVADPARYGVTLEPIPDKAYFTAVDVGSQIDLALVAKLTDQPLNEVYRLNPGFNRWATAPRGPHRVLVPTDMADQFRQQLAELDPGDRVHWIRHKVRFGETLGDISLHYHTTIAVIKEVNSLRGNMIRGGHYLMVPVASKRLSSYTLSQEQRREAIQNTPKGSTKLEHEVVAGDTLWDLARHYRVSVTGLAAWNGMAPGDTLRPGQRLVIWTDNSDLAGALKKTMLAGPNSEMSMRRITYRVRHGDSLARISQHFNVSVSDLTQWNNLDNQQYIQPGQKLTLYVDVTQLGDNI
jgi:membrane-bound lytic murein transglycosylase D